MAEGRQPSDYGDLEWLPPSRLSKGRGSSTPRTIADGECLPRGSPTISPRTTRSDGSLLEPATASGS